MSEYKPLVSIIMSCYNGEKFLDKVNSIKDQNYYHWELIFWDNQSTDKVLISLEIIKTEI